MKNRVYLISDQFNYSQLIANDAGPEYARQMGWKIDTLENIRDYASELNIIDNRITQAESRDLARYVHRSPDTMFLLTIVDPYYHHRDNWYYRFLETVKQRDNVYFLSKYAPAELVKDLDEATGKRKLVVLPYPFLDVCQLSDDLSRRHKMVIFTGALDTRTYPLRTRFITAVRDNPLLWNKVSFLPHPGYPDIGETARHDLLGRRYVEHLSKFYFMFLEPSRCDLEFLKYSECAYAHCVPVGRAPSSFTPDMKKPLVEFDFDQIDTSIERLFSLSHAELAGRASDYYRALKINRNVDLLNERLDTFLQEAAVCQGSPTGSPA